jgi:hypothetical protein
LKAFVGPVLFKESSSFTTPAQHTECGSELILLPLKARTTSPG